MREVDDKIIFYDSEKMIFYGLKGALALYIAQEKDLEISKMVSYLLKVYDVHDKTATEDV